MGTVRTIVIGTAVAGSLDILSAFVFAGMGGHGPLGVLTSVATGPFGEVPITPHWAFVGLLVHFAIMAVMVAAYVLIAPSVQALFDSPIVAGILYGLLLWGIMYWLVLPWRFGIAAPHLPMAIAKQLFSHIVCVGWPIAFVAKAGARR